MSIKNELENITALQLWNESINMYASLSKLNTKLASSFTDGFLIFSKAMSEPESLQNIQNFDKSVTSKIRNKFDSDFREDGFVTALSEVVGSYSKLAKITYLSQFYKNMSNLSSLWNNAFIEPLRDTVLRTPSHRIYSENKFSLYHYEDGVSLREKDDRNAKTGNSKKSGVKNNKIQLLIIYAFINRHYILDLLPHISIVRNLIGQGLDIFATDRGTPGAYDEELTLGHYVNNYLDNSIDQIRKHTNSDKVSLLGYCWGGDLALMYSSLHPEKVKSIVTLATPGDFSLDNGLLSVWTRNVNADLIVDSFGNMSSTLLNIAFALRSPIDFLHKYPHFFFEGKPRDLESIAEFFATEMWLYDSPPVIGEIYRQFVNDCYKQNLLIKNQMKIGNNMLIDLNNIKMPFLNIVAAKDDLVAPSSSKALNDAVGSSPSDKTIMEFQSGHVDTCISSAAHRELWPKVGDWLKGN